MRNDKRKISRRDVLKGSSAAALTVYASPSPRGRAAGRGDDAGADRGGEEGRQGRLLHLGRSAARREGRARRSRRNTPASRSGSSAPAPSACSSASARSMAATSTPSTWSIPRTPRTSSSGSATACLRPTCPRTSPSIIRPSTGTRTGCSRASASSCASMGYNTNLVKAEDAPKSFADLLDPKWTGKIVKAHPGYSGTILTATFRWRATSAGAIFEKLAKQKIMQVQSASDPPKKLALGERADHGRRHRIRHVPAQGEGQAGRARSTRPKARR